LPDQKEITRVIRLIDELLDEYIAA